MGTGPGPHERLNVLVQALRDLERYRDTITRERFESDPDATRQVKNALYEAADAAIAVAQHVASREGLGVPGSYRDVFVMLGANGRLRPDLATHMADWAAFRNVIAHFYTVLDLDRLHERRTTRLDDLAEFAAWAAADLASPRTP
jgi:uncharacterized protein YutE (UPF0331/DUF86 family)